MSTAPQLLLFIATLFTNFMLSLLSDSTSSNQNADLLLGSSVSNSVPYVDLSQMQLAGMTAGEDFNTLLAGLLDIGAARNQFDDSVSYVPPLDGRNPVNSDSYFMTFVPFDIKLVSIKTVDPLGSSFTIQWKMILQWVDIVSSNNDGKTSSFQNCSFVCDTTNSDYMCCDDVWVPPLNIPQCSIDSIDSRVDDTLSVYWYFSSSKISSYTDCINNPGSCFGRRFWKLNIQTTCDSEMNFKNFPFDIQLLTMDILNPYSSRTWLQLVSGTLLSDGGDIVNGDPPLGNTYLL